MFPSRRAVLLVVVVFFLLVLAATRVEAHVLEYTAYPRVEMAIIEELVTPEEPLPDAAGVPAHIWYDLAVCETGMSPTGVGERLPRWSYNGSSGFDGGLQWLPSSWDIWAPKVLMDPPSFAWEASPADQVRVAGAYVEYERAQGRGGFGPWPRCADILGLPR